MWYVFSDSPAKREYFKKLATAKKLPLKFCATIWLDDVPIAESSHIMGRYENIC